MNDKKVRFAMNHGEKYLPITNDDDDTSHLLFTDSDASSTLSHGGRTSQASVLALFSIFFVSCLISSICGLIAGRRYPSDSGTIHHVSKWSPVIDEVPVKFHTEQFNGTFVHENIYRQGASPEVDNAWDELGVRCKYFTITSQLNSREVVALTRV
jgi:hypothetical protein